MSKTVDQRVVSMQFDNSNFEKNVSTTMNTLEKFKAALNLDGATKGLDNVEKAANKMDFSKCEFTATQAGFHISDVFEKVTRYLEGDLARAITNTGYKFKKLMDDFTVVPMSTGFDEYQLKMGSIQTIMASTGESLETVNRYLNELNQYSDDTIYSFQDMTSNIGKFTNAGVKLEDAVLAIKGVSNEAAISGANANEASRAMYNFAQALSAGYVKLIDWKSIENANMATVEFKNQLLETALEMKTVEKTADGMYRVLTTNASGSEMDSVIDATHNFNDSLAYQWMTSDVLVTTLGKYADETTDIGKRATEAATKVKTFSMMMDALKESAQSGWAQTWEIIFGDFNQGTELWTNISKVVGNILDTTADARNKLLELSFQGRTKWNDLSDAISKSGISVDTFNAALKGVLSENGKDLDKLLKDGQKIEDLIKSGELRREELVATIKKITSGVNTASESIEEVTDKVEYFNNIVNRVIQGEFGNGEERINALTEAGYNYSQVQSLINHIWERNGETWDDCTLSGAELAAVMGEMSEAELESIGLTEKQIKALQELSEYAEITEEEFNDIIAKMTRPTGRDLVLNSFANAYKGLVAVFESIRNSWEEIFPPKSTEERAEALYSLITAINEFSKGLILNEEDVDKLTRTFKGLFAIIDIVRMIVGGPLNLAFRAIKAVLSAFNIDILDATATVGDFIVAIRDWMKAHDPVGKAIEKIVPVIVNAVKATYDWVTSNKLLADGFNSIKNAIKNPLESIKDFVQSAKESGNIPKYIIQGLVNGIRNGLPNVISSGIEIAKSLFESVCKFLKIQSPSRKFMEIGEFVVQGLVNGIRNSSNNIDTVVRFVKDKILAPFTNIASEIDFSGVTKTLSDVFHKIPWDLVLAGGIATGGIFGVVKIFTGIISIIKPFSDLMGNVGELLESVSKGITNVSKSVTKLNNAKALKEFAVALLLLVSALLLLSTIDPSRLRECVTVLGVLATGLVAIAVVMTKFTKTTTEMQKSTSLLSKIFPKINSNVIGLGAMLLGLGTALLLMTAVIAIIGKMNMSQAMGGFLGLTSIMGIMVLFLLGVSELVKGKTAQNIDKVGVMFTKLAVTMLLMIAVCKLAGKLSDKEMQNGAIFVGALAVFMGYLSLIGLIPSKNVTKLATSLEKIAVAMGLMVIVAKMAGLLSASDMTKAVIFATGFLGFATLLSVISLIPSLEKNIENLSKSLVRISMAMGLMVTVYWMVGTLSESTMVKGLSFLASFTAFMFGLNVIGLIPSKGLNDASKNILTISSAVGIMALTAMLLSILSVEHLAKGVIAVSILGSVVSGMIAIAKLGKGEIKDIKSLSICVAVLAASVLALSFIKPEKLAGATLAMTIVMGVMVGLIAVSKLAGNNMKTIIALTACVSILAGIIALLSMIEPNKLLGASTAMGIVMTTMALMMAASKLASGDLTGVLGMVIMLGAIGLALGIMSQFDSKAMIAAAEAIAIAALSLSVSMAIFAALGALALPALIGVGTLTAILLALGALSQIPGFNWLISEGGKALEGIGEAIGRFIGGLVGAFTSKTSEMLPKLAEKLSDFGVKLQPFINSMTSMNGDILENGLKLVALIIALTAAELIEKMSSWVKGTKNLSSFGTQLKAFGKAIAEFSETVKGRVDNEAVEAAASAGKIMTEMAKTVPNSGGLLGKFFGENDIDIFGAMLVAFGNSIVKFSETVSGKVDGKAVEAAASAGEMMSKMAKTIPNSGGVVGWFMGNNDLDEFGARLVSFGHAITLFSGTVSGKVNQLAITATACAGQMMAMMASTIPNSGGIVSWFTGSNDIDEFGKKLIPFGNCMALFSQAIAGKIDPKSAEAAANAGKALAEMESTIPETGGLAQGFLGEVDMNKFSLSLVGFGNCIVAFSQTLKNAGGIDNDMVNSAAAAGKMIAEMEATIPESGGLAEGFLGKVDMNKFGMDLLKFGNAMIMFSQGLLQNGGINEEAVSAAGRMGTMFASLESSLGKTDGVVQFLEGQKDLGKFGQRLKEFALGLVGFSNTIRDNGGLSTAAINYASYAGKAMAELSNNLPDNQSKFEKWFNGDDTLKGFGDNLKAFGKAIVDYSKEMKSLNVIGLNQAITCIEQLIDILDKLSEANSTALPHFAQAMSNAGTESIDKFVQAFKNSDYKATNALGDMFTSLISVVTVKGALFKSAIKNAIEAGADAIGEYGDKYNSETAKIVDGAKSGANRKLVEMLKECISLVQSYESDFKEAGSNVALGIKNGIDSVKSKVVDSVEDMSEDVIKAFKTMLDIHSPSRVFDQFGRYIDLGLINGINYGSSGVNNSIEDLANSAVSGMGDALSQIKDTYDDTNIDVGVSVRPVVVDSNLVNVDTSTKSTRTEDVYSNLYFNGDKDLIAALDADKSRNLAIINHATFDGDFMSIESLRRAIEDLDGSVSSLDESIGTMSSGSVTNNFEINGVGNPRDVADEVSRILQQQIERRDAAWA